MSTSQAFLAQVNSDVYLTDLFYIIATTGAMIGVLSLMLLDAGLVQSKNQIDTIVQKVLCTMIGGLSFMIVGYAVWNWQFYQALGIEGAFGRSVSDWWLMGHNMMAASQHFDPA